jgi:hypothetical protein
VRVGKNHIMIVDSNEFPRIDVVQTPDLNILIQELDQTITTDFLHIHDSLHCTLLVRHDATVAMLPRVVKAFSSFILTMSSDKENEVDFQVENGPSKQSLDL